jgi:hypothetical protein
MAGVRWGERRILRRTSHQSLKVAVFRDQPFDAPTQGTPADSYVHGDWDADYRRADLEHNGAAVNRAAVNGAAVNGATYGQDPDDEDTGPLTVVRDVAPQAPDRLEDVSWDEAARREQRSLPANALTFKAAPRPWYGSPRILLLAVGLAIAAMIVAGVLLALRSSSDGDEDSTPVTPTATSSAVPPPPPSDTVGDPLPPAEVPPPPPPPEESTPAPRGNGGYYWTPSPHSQTPTGRPREPAPISVSPQPHNAPEPGHSAPGDAPRHRGFFG